MRCRCGYRFVFDPKIDGLADGKFISAIRTAGKNGSQYFLKEQLYTAYLARIQPPVIGLRITALLLGGLAFYLAFVKVYTFALVLAVVMAIVFNHSFAGRVPITEFDRLLEKWIGRKGPIPDLICEPSLFKPPPKWKEGDIYDYGVERILVVEHDLLVDFFVFNDFHASSRALIVSYSGYPDYLVPRMKKMLNDHKDLSVFFIHDAGEAGLSKAQALKEKGLFGLSVPHIIDLGMNREDVKKIKRIKAGVKGGDRLTVPVSLVPALFLMELTGVAMDNEESWADILPSSSAMVITSFG